MMQNYTYSTLKASKNYAYSTLKELKNYTYSTLEHINLEKMSIVLDSFIINPLYILAYSSLIRRNFVTFALYCRN